MPCCASPAIASPAVIATAAGRNSGSTIASAASGYSVAVVEHGGEERRSGAGPRRDLGQRQQHRDQGRQRVDHARSSPRYAGSGAACSARRRSSAPTSAPSRPGRSRSWSPRARPPRACAAPGPARIDPHPALDEQPVERGGVVVPDHEPVAVGLLDLAVEQRAGRGRRRGCAPAAGRSGRGASASASCSTSRPRSSTPTRSHSCSTSASRWQDRKTVVPVAVQVAAAARGSRGCPAGRARWSARRG